MTGEEMYSIYAAQQHLLNDFLCKPWCDLSEKKKNVWKAIADQINAEWDRK